jgi:hypothetical protein
MPRSAQRTKRSVRTVFGRTIVPAAAALENANYPADNAAVVHPINPTHVCGQMRLDPSSLLIVQPKKIAAHHPTPFKANQDRMESGN